MDEDEHHKNYISNRPVQLSDPLNCYSCDYQHFTFILGSNVKYEKAGFEVKINVNAETENVLLDYAFALQNGNYSDPNSRPYFKFRIRNDQGQVLNDPQQLTFTQGTESKNGFTYQDWVFTTISLHQYFGQTIILQFEAGDSPTGVSSEGDAYGYLRLACKAGYHEPKGGCSNDTVSFELMQHYDYDEDNNSFNRIDNLLYGFTPHPAVITPTAPFIEKDTPSGFYINILKSGNYYVEKSYSKPGNRDISIITQIAVREGTAGCDTIVETMTGGCTDTPVLIKYKKYNYYDDRRYYFKWEFSGNYRISKVGAEEYISYCEPGIKPYHLKIYKRSNNELVKDIQRSLLMKDCIGQFGGFSLPDSACAGDAIEYKSDFVNSMDQNKFSAKWYFSGPHTLSPTSNPPKVLFSYLGPRYVNLKVTNNKTGCASDVTKSVFMKDCYGLYDCCPTSFSPQQGSYIFSGWINFDPSVPRGQQPYFRLKVNYQNGNTNYFQIRANDLKNIEGWYQATGEISIQPYPLDMSLEMVNSSNSDAYFDDIRMQPFNSIQKGYVYDNQTKRMVAELDENNYGTFYEYDEEGNLIRLKKETERGIMMIQESNRNSNKPKP